MAQREERALKITEGRGDAVRSKVLMQTLFLVFITGMFLTPSRPANTQILEDRSAHRAAFLLTIQDELISLDAKEASLKAIPNRMFGTEPTRTSYRSSIVLMK